MKIEFDSICQVVRCQKWHALWGKRNHNIQDFVASLTKFKLDFKVILFFIFQIFFSILPKYSFYFLIVDYFH